MLRIVRRWLGMGSAPADHAAASAAAGSVPPQLITAIELPAPAPRSAYLKVRERESYEYATLSTAATVEIDNGVIRQARIALGSVAHRPWRLDEAERRLVGLRAGSPEIRTAIDAAFTEARPLSRNAYKIPLARNAALRILQTVTRVP